MLCIITKNVIRTAKSGKTWQFLSYVLEDGNVGTAVNDVGLSGTANLGEITDLSKLMDFDHDIQFDQRGNFKGVSKVVSK